MQKAGAIATLFFIPSNITRGIGWCRVVLAEL
jgi:hypothetical protein